MDSETIINKVKTILENNTTLKAYIKAVFLGDREKIYGDVFPCIVIDAPNDRMSSQTKGNLRDNTLTVNIIPATLIRDREKALIGDATNRGIMDIITDIKKALNTYYPSLDKTCLYFSLSVEQIGDFPDFTGKFATIGMSISYREAI